MKTPLSLAFIAGVAVLLAGCTLPTALQKNTAGENTSIQEQSGTTTTGTNGKTTIASPTPKTTQESDNEEDLQKEVGGVSIESDFNALVK